MNKFIYGVLVSVLVFSMCYIAAFLKESREEVRKIEFGYSYDGRRWIIERNFGKGIGKTDLVYEVNEAGEKIGNGLRYKSSWRRFEMEGNISGSIPDDRRIQINDNTIIEFSGFSGRRVNAPGIDADGDSIMNHNLDSDKREHLINNPDPAHIGILTKECSLTNFLGGGYEHTTLEQVNRFTECCTPEHYKKLIDAGDRSLKEEIRFAERALDEAIKNFLEKIESYENE